MLLGYEHNIPLHSWKSLEISTTPVSVPHFLLSNSVIVYCSIFRFINSQFILEQYICSLGKYSLVFCRSVESYKLTL